MPEELSERISVRLTPGQRRRIEELAAGVGLRPSTYLRAVGLGEKLPHRPGQPTREAIHQLARVGNNLNQAVKFAHTHGHFRSEGELREVLEEVHRALRELV